MPTPIGPLQRYAYIDALRGLAFLAVLVIHCAHVCPGLPWRVAATAEQGARGVQLFFIVSALTLILSLRSRAAREQRPTANFFIRRLARIAPLFWAGILAYYAFGRLYLHQAPADAPGWRCLAFSALFAHAWDPRSMMQPVVPGGWSIAVEMSFYLTVPFLFARLTTLTRALWAVLGTLLFSLLLRELMLRAVAPAYPADFQALYRDFLFYWLPSQAPVFLLGFVLFFLIKDPRTGPSPDRSPAPSARSRWLVLTAVFAAFALVGDGYRYLPGHVLYGISFVLLSWGLSLYPYRLLVNRATCFWGRISYSGYLTQFAVIQVVADYLPDLLARGGLRLSPVAYFALVYLLALAGTSAVATVTYYLIEVPGMAVGQRLVSLNERRGQPAEAARQEVLTR